VPLRRPSSAEVEGDPSHHPSSNNTKFTSASLIGGESTVSVEDTSPSSYSTTYRHPKKPTRLGQSQLNWRSVSPRSQVLNFLIAASANISETPLGQGFNLSYTGFPPFHQLVVVGQGPTAAVVIISGRTGQCSRRLAENVTQGRSRDRVSALS
jgi:hypothetical protein